MRTPSIGPGSFPGFYHSVSYSYLLGGVDAIDEALWCRGVLAK